MISHGFILLIYCTLFAQLVQFPSILAVWLTMDFECLSTRWAFAIRAPCRWWHCGSHSAVLRRAGAAWPNWTILLKPMVWSWGRCRYLQLQESPKSRLGKLGPTWPVKPVCCPPWVSLGVCERRAEGKLLKLALWGRDIIAKKAACPSESQLAQSIPITVVSKGGDEEVLTTLLGQRSRHVFLSHSHTYECNYSWLGTLTGGCASLQQRQWLTARRRQTYVFQRSCMQW